MKREQCRAICSVESGRPTETHQQGKRCPERALPGVEPALCWLHAQAYDNKNRTQPLKLVESK